MIILDSTTKSLEVTLGGVVTLNQLPWTVNYIDVLDSDQSVFDIGAADGVTAGVTPVTMVAAPASGHTRQIKTLNIHNADTASATIIIQLNNNSTIRTIWKGTILTLENLNYDD